MARIERVELRMAGRPAPASIARDADCIEAIWRHKALAQGGASGENIRCAGLPAFSDGAACQPHLRCRTADMSGTPQLDDFTRFRAGAFRAALEARSIGAFTREIGA